MRCFDWRQNFHELKLNERPGRFRHTYIRGDGCANKLYTFIIKTKEEPNRSMFQFPSILKAANVIVHYW